MSRHVEPPTSLAAPQPGPVPAAPGHRIDQDLPGSDRPDLTERFLADHLAWLPTDG